MAIVLRVLLLALLLLPMGAGRSQGVRSSSVLLLHDLFGESPCPTPTFLRDHQASLESLHFDGIIVYLRRPDLSDNITMSVLTNQPVGYAAISRVLAPLRGIEFTSLTRNFALVIAAKPPDLFEDWSVPIRNFAELARAIREVGLTGICFDNEGYFSRWADYPEGSRYPQKSHSEYQEQARVRGRQVMEAMVAEFPDITVISFHGPYVSEPRAPARFFPQWQSSNELLGPFFCGFVEGAGSRTVCVDGGELYQLRTERDFRESHAWRKHTIASREIGDSFIPASLRASWSAKVSIGFGVYDRPFGGGDMNPDLLRRTLALALRQADGYVWFNVERASFLKEAGRGGATEPWVEAVRLGRRDAR